MEGEPPSGVCQECLEQLQLEPSWRCTVCGRVLSGREGPCCPGADPDFLDGLLSVAGFGDPARLLVHNFKYHSHAPAGRALSILYARGVEGSLDVPCEMVIPVPLSRKKRGNRGFNQSALLARRLGSALGLTVHYRSLKRVRETGSQTGLDPGERRENVSGAFAADRKTDMDGINCLLVDDIYTTGATMQECARVLKGNGAAGVFGAVFACAAIKGDRYTPSPGGGLKV
jgi:ComF family protein